MCKGALRYVCKELFAGIKCSCDSATTPFYNLRRGTKRIMDYFIEIKTVCDSLTAVESPVIDHEQVQHILCTVRLEYIMLCTALQVLPTLPTLHEFKTKLFQHETQYTNVASDTAHVVLYANTLARVQREITHMTTLGAGG